VKDRKGKNSRSVRAYILKVSVEQQCGDATRYRTGSLACVFFYFSLLSHEIQMHRVRTLAFVCLPASPARRQPVVLFCKVEAQKPAKKKKMIRRICEWLIFAAHVAKAVRQDVPVHRRQMSVK
jgi:hypothetical protein